MRALKFDMDDIQKSRQGIETDRRITSLIIARRIEKYRSTKSGSKKTVAASSNRTPCLRQFASALFESQVKTSPLSSKRTSTATILPSVFTLSIRTGPWRKGGDYDLTANRSGIRGRLESFPRIDVRASTSRSVRESVNLKRVRSSNRTSSDRNTYCCGQMRLGSDTRRAHGARAGGAFNVTLFAREVMPAVSARVGAPALAK
jgi:hypothetical protein